MEFHVTCRQNKKIVRLPSANVLLDELCRQFRVTQPMLLQEWNIEYQDWVDVEYTSLLKNKSKLRILFEDVDFSTVSATSTTTSGNSGAATSSIPASHVGSSLSALLRAPTLPPTDPPVDDEIVREEVTAAASQAASGLLNLLSQPSNLLTTSAVVSSTEGESGSLQSWSTNFKVPSEKTFPGELKKALNKKQVPLDKHSLCLLLDVLFVEMRKYTRYPTSGEYEQVAIALLAKYQWLCEGFPYSVALDRWKSRLMQKFRNCRKRFIGFTEDEVSSRKRNSALANLLRNSSSTSQSTSAISGTTVWPSLVQQLLNGGYGESSRMNEDTTSSLENDLEDSLTEEANGGLCLRVKQEQPVFLEPEVDE